MSFDSNPQFPSEFVSPKIKEDDDYGLAYAKAMYYASNRHGARLLYDDLEYDALIEIAQGRQSTDNIKKLFGYYDIDSQSTDGGAEDLAYIDVQVLNLAPKYINRAVGRLQAMKYDVSASVLDVKSINQEKHYKAQVKAFAELKVWFDTIGVSAKRMLQQAGIDNIPEETDEMLYEMTTNPKVKKIIKVEKLIKLIHYSNKWLQISRELDWDLVTLGKAFVHCYLDRNGSVREERINPRWAVYPYSESEDWSDVDYFGFIDFVPTNQFIRESSETLTPAEQQEIILTYGRDNKFISSTEGVIDEARNDGLTYVPVLRYYFLSEDRKAVDVKKNRHGNKILVERAYDYSPPEEMQHLYTPEGGNKIIKNTYTSLYAGCWVIDSETVYTHRRVNWPRKYLVDISPPIKAYAPNYKEGRTVSMLAQMIEPIFMINVAWNKMKDILAKGWMGVREINFDEIEKIALGKGGKQWTPRQVYEHLLKTNTLVKRGKTNMYDQSNGSAIQDGPAGLSMADYMNTISMSMKFLDELTGSASFEGAAPPERLAVGVAQANLQATHETMEYLYAAHHRLYLEVSKTVIDLAQLSYKMGNKVAGNAMGEYFEMDDDVAYSEFGIMLERQPNEQEWLEFYQDLRLMLKEGQIRASDSAYVREVDNLKEARRVLAIREEKYLRIKRKEQEQIKNDQIEMSGAASQAKLDAEISKIKAKHESDRELKILQGQIDEMLLDAEYGYNAAKEKEKGVSALNVKQQEGKDRIITQGMKNIVESKKVEKREDKSPED
jgi:hypothetical protein